MREPKPVLVTNTTPLIALAPANGNLEILRFLYGRVVVPLEVAEEVCVGGKQSFGLDVFNGAQWLGIQAARSALAALLEQLAGPGRSVGHSDRHESGLAPGRPLPRCCPSPAHRAPGRMATRPAATQRRRRAHQDCRSPRVRPRP